MSECKHEHTFYRDYDNAEVCGYCGMILQWDLFEPEPERKGRLLPPEKFNRQIDPPVVWSGLVIVNDSK